MHDATKVSTNYSSMLEGGMQASLGTVTTAPGLEFKNLSADDNVFFLTPSASGDDIPTNPNGHQMCFADGNQGKVAAEFVNANFAGQTIGVFFKSDEAYSKGIYDKFKANLDSSVTVVETSFSDANSTDFSTQIDTLKSCDFIFMPIYYTPASYGAMERASAEGSKIPVTISASDLCEILKAQFSGGYTLTGAVTGDSISWDSTGYVNKSAIQYIIKDAN